MWSAVGRSTGRMCNKGCCFVDNFIDKNEKTAVSSITSVIFLLFVLGLLLLYFAFVKLAGAPGDIGTVGMKFLLGRIQGRPLLDYEIRGTIYFIIFIIGFAVLSALIASRITTFVKKKKKERLLYSRYASQYGSSEWGCLDEIRSILGNDGVVVGATRKIGWITPVRLSSRYSFEHIAVIGPTGCGKSTCFFIPNLLMLFPGSSAVVTDPKGELEQITAPYLRKNGWNIQVFAPMSPEISCGYDPLRCARNDVEVADIADIILKNGYDPEGRGGDTQWINFSVPLFEAVLYAAKQQSQNTATVKNAVRIVTEMDEQSRAELFKGLGGTALSRYLTYLQSIESPETAGSIRTVLTSSVRIFSRPDVEEVSSKNPLIRFNALREKPTVLFVRIPERKAHLLKPLMATFFWQLLEHIADIPGNPVYFFLDEFPNIGKIPGFAAMAATLRSRKISLCVGMQGVEQLTREYSQEEQKDILNNLKTKIYFPGSSGETGQYASALAGYATAKESNALHRVELLNAAELRTIPEGKIMLMTRNYQPLLLDVLHYSKIAL